MSLLQWNEPNSLENAIFVKLTVSDAPQDDEDWDVMTGWVSMWSTESEKWTQNEITTPCS